MRKFSTHITDRQLVIKRDRTKDLLFCVSLSAVIGAFIGFFMGHLPEHNNVSLGERLGVFPAFLSIFGLLGKAVFVLRRQELVFDRVLGQVIVNGQPVHALTELQSVDLERSFYTEGRSVKLYLQMKSRVKMEIVSDGVFGVSESEMRSLAETLAEFAQINLITPDEFIPAISKLPATHVVPKKWGRKGFRQPRP